MGSETNKSFVILLIEDNPADIRLMLEILKEGDIPSDFHVATDGEEGMRFLRQEAPFETAPRPDLVFLDLNLPKIDGREVLRLVKSDPALKRIPVVVMSSSEAAEDVEHVYEYHANCYITKPVDLEEFEKVGQLIKSFWLRAVKLPNS